MGFGTVESIQDTLFIEVSNRTFLFTDFLQKFVYSLSVDPELDAMFDWINITANLHHDFANGLGEPIPFIYFLKSAKKVNFYRNFDKIAPSIMLLRFLGLQPYQGVDFSVEIPKVQEGGGIFLWSVINLFQDVINCKNNSKDNTELCRWLGNLRYMVYSAV